VVKIRIFSLTKLGKRVAGTKEGGDAEIRVLQFLKENRTGTEDELEVAGGERWILRGLEREGLITELTTGR